MKSKRAHTQFDEYLAKVGRHDDVTLGMIKIRGIVNTLTYGYPLDKDQLKFILDFFKAKLNGRDADRELHVRVSGRPSRAYRDIQIAMKINDLRYRDPKFKKTDAIKLLAKMTKLSEERIEGIAKEQADTVKKIRASGDLLFKALFGVKAPTVKSTVIRAAEKFKKKRRHT